VAKATPGALVGAALYGSEKMPFITLEAAIVAATKAGHVPGKTLRFIENKMGRVAYYGPGATEMRKMQRRRLMGLSTSSAATEGQTPEGQTAGKAGKECWTLDPSYTTAKATLGEDVGAELNGSGKTTWTTLNGAVAVAVRYG
jgi:hypothetical protein